MAKEPASTAVLLALAVGCVGTTAATVEPAEGPSNARTRALCTCAAAHMARGEVDDDKEQRARAMRTCAAALYACCII